MTSGGCRGGKEIENEMTEYRYGYREEWRRLCQKLTYHGRNIKG
jgi:hypothetical protein